MKILLLAITIFSWGVWGFLNKLAVQRMHPLQMFVVGCCINLVLLPIYAFTLKASNVNQPWNIGSIALCTIASLASTIGTIAYVYGIRTGDLGTIAVLSCAYPVLTVFLATLFLGETLTMSKIIGIILVMVGVIVLGR